MILDEFEQKMSAENISVKVNNIALDLKRYKEGDAIHRLSPLESNLFWIYTMVEKGCLKDVKTFKDLSIKQPQVYQQIISYLYEGSQRGLFSI